MIRLGLGVEAGRLFAPRIVTPEGIGLARDDSGPTPVESVTIPRPVEGSQAIPFQTLGIEPAKLQPLGAETWVYDGDLCGPWRLWLRAHLVVRGSFCCAANSLLDGDVKAGGALSIGDGTVVRGNLSAAGDLGIGVGCVFQGDIQGQQRVRLGSGVRGFRAGGPVAVDAAGGRLPVLTGVAESSTALAGRYAADAARLGVDGLMVLPAMVYKADEREAIAHFRAVARATELPVLCYNNPVSYGVDLTPSMFAELADEPTLVAIKESSGDVRRITDLVNLLGDRYLLFTGVDDLVLESALLGSQGWVSGLVNAFPHETVRLYEHAAAGRIAEARALYRWFMPLLHLDCHSKLVQYIKLANQMTGLGSEWVRPPRLTLEGEERERVAGIIRHALETRPNLAAEAAA